MSVKYKCKFQDGQFSDERFKSWLQKHDSNVYDTFCKFCQKRFSIAGHGEKQIESHMKGEKQTRKSTNISKQQ